MKKKKKQKLHRELGSIRLHCHSWCFTIFTDLQADPLSFERSCRLFISPLTKTYIYVYILCHLAGILVLIQSNIKKCFVVYLENKFLSYRPPGADRPPFEDTMHIRHCQAQVSADTHYVNTQITSDFFFFFIVKCMFSV